MLLIIDNYDSFTYNLYHYFGELGYEAQVHRNDEIAVDQIINLKPKGIVISPGPCGPEKAGISVDLVKAVADNTTKGQEVSNIYQPLSRASPPLEDILEAKSTDN